MKLYHKLGSERKVVPVLEGQSEKDRLCFAYRKVGMSKSVGEEGLRDVP